MSVRAVFSYMLKSPMCLIKNQTCVDPPVLVSQSLSPFSDGQISSKPCAFLASSLQSTEGLTHVFLLPNWGILDFSFVIPHPLCDHTVLNAPSFMLSLIFSMSRHLYHEHYFTFLTSFPLLFLPYANSLLTCPGRQLCFFFFLLLKNGIIPS